MEENNILQESMEEQIAETVTSIVEKYEEESEEKKEEAMVRSELGVKGKKRPKLKHATNMPLIAGGQGRWTNETRKCCGENPPPPAGMRPCKANASTCKNNGAT